MMTSQTNNDSSAADAAAGVLCALPFVRGIESTWNENEPATKKTKFFHSVKPEFQQTPDVNTIGKLSKTQASKAPKTNKPLPKETAGSNQAPTAAPPGIVGVAAVALNGHTVSVRKIQDPVKKKQTRLEQNRRAAKESRQRKNVMVEELQRSVVFFTRANSTLKEENDELVRLVNEALKCDDMTRSDRSVLDRALDENTNNYDASKCATHTSLSSLHQYQTIDPEKERIVAKAESSTNMDNKKKGSSSVSRNGTSEETSRFRVDAATDSSARNAIDDTLETSMQPGSTMQAMASFQQAATVAMEEAMKGLHSSEGVNALKQLLANGSNVTPLAATTEITASIPIAPSAATPSAAAAALTSAVANAQQAYNDTMAKFAMQQAAHAAGAAAAAANPNAWMFSSLPFMMNPATMFAWQMQHQPYLQQEILQQQQLQLQAQALSQALSQIQPLTQEQADPATVAAWTDLSNLKNSKV